VGPTQQTGPAQVPPDQPGRAHALRGTLTAAGVADHQRLEGLQLEQQGQEGLHLQIGAALHGRIRQSAPRVHPSH